MELITKSKRPGMNCYIDVFYEETKGISAHINDRNTYKMMLVKSGSFVIEEDWMVISQESNAINKS